MEHPPFWWYLPGKMGIFHGRAVSFREGNGETTTNLKAGVLSHQSSHKNSQPSTCVVGPCSKDRIRKRLESRICRGSHVLDMNKFPRIPNVLINVSNENKITTVGWGLLQSLPPGFLTCLALGIPINLYKPLCATTTRKGDDPRS